MNIMSRFCWCVQINLKLNLYNIFFKTFLGVLYHNENEAEGRTTILKELHKYTVVAKGDAREVGDHELELFQICQSTSLPGLPVNFFRR